MIFVGIDDTDTLETRGTNQLARAMVRGLADDWICRRIVRHQLLSDPRIPCTSKNGSASIALEPRHGKSLEDLALRCRQMMLDDFIPGSDPGLCIAGEVPSAVVEFAHRCQQQIVTQEQARELASEHGIYLEGLGGTEGGVIGALAAVGLGWFGDDGRIVQWEHWPDDLCGPVPATDIRRRNLLIQQNGTGALIESGTIDVGKHLRPNLRARRGVLFVETAPGPADHYVAVKLH